jgi:hypothetical protein
LKPGHISSKCNDKLVCKTCEKKHPSALHDPFWKPSSKKRQTAQTTSKENVEKNDQDRVNSGLTACSITEAGDVPVNMGIVPVWLYHKSEPEKRIKVYALLDNGSGGTFIKTETMERLGIDGEDTTLVLTTMHGIQEMKTKVVNGLVAVNCEKEDVHLLHGLGHNKASGIDGISSRILKLSAAVISPSLTSIFNQSILTGIFPNDWKIARITLKMK